MINRFTHFLLHYISSAWRASSILTHKPSYIIRLEVFTTKEGFSTYLDVHGEVTPDNRLFYTLSTRGLRPIGRCKCLHIIRKGNRRETLEQSDKEVWHFIVRKLPTCQNLREKPITQGDTHLLTQTDSWTSIERWKDKRVGSQVLVEPFIEESIRIKLVSWGTRVSHET